MSLAVIRTASVLALVAAPVAAEPVKLKLERQPPRLRMRVAATPKPEPAPEPEPAADVKQIATDPNLELGVLRDLRRPISVRFNLGYVVDGAASTGLANQDWRHVGDHEWAQLRAYALGEGYFSSRGVILPSLSTYFAGRFQLVRRSLKTDPSVTPTGPSVEVAPPVATWFEESGTTVRSGWAEVKDFLPDKRLAPLRVRVGNQYVYGPWPLHMVGLLAAWEGRLVRGSVYAGSRVPDYTNVAVLDKDRAAIAGSSLRLDFRNLKTPVPFAISGEFLGFTDIGRGDVEASNHALVQLDWRPRKDVALIGRVRTLEGDLANEHLQLRTRYKQVTNLVFDVVHRRKTDWRWDPAVTQPDPAQAQRYLDLGPVLPQILVSGRAGTLIKENVDVLLRSAYANDLVTTMVERNTYAASYFEFGGALELRLRRTIGLGLNGLTRQTKRYATVSGEIPDIPNQIDRLPRPYSPEVGERGFTELGTTVRLTLGARRFSALVEVYGRRTRYALTYCAALRNGIVNPACMDPEDTGIHDKDYRGGGRVTIDAWITSQLRLFASYDLSSRLDLYREIYGFKSLRLMMEGVY